MCKKIFPIEMSKAQGYGKVDKNLQQLIDSGHDILVVSDLNLTVEQFQKAADHFKEIYYFDHHLPSAEIEEIFGEQEGIYIYYSDRMSASGILHQYAKRNDYELDNSLTMLCIMTDVYDMWRTDHKLWDDGYKLNDLFWKNGFWGFESQFEDGFHGFTREDVEYCQEIKQKRIDIIEESPTDLTKDEKGVVILLTDRQAVNDVSLYFNAKYDGHFSAYYIVVRDGENYNCSVRLTNEDYDANEALKTCLEKHPKIIVSGGGHKMAGGFQFSPKINIDNVFKYIKSVLHETLVS